MRSLERGSDKPCQCVFRAIFRACYDCFREFANASEQPGAVTLESNHGRTGYRLYSLKRQEYVADFCLAARRALPPEDYKVFRYIYLMGANVDLCDRFLGIERGTCFRTVYRIEAVLGKYLAELQPYALYPIDEYMGGTVRVGKMDVGSAGEEVLRKRRRRRREPLPMIA